MKILNCSKKLTLINKGELEIIPLGAGAAFAKNSFQTNWLIVKGDTHLMVDFGTKGPTALSETAGLEVIDIGAFLLTHTHADHIGGMENAALMNRYAGIPFAGKSKLKLLTTQAFAKIVWDESLRGGLAHNESPELKLEDLFEIVLPDESGPNLRDSWIFHFGTIKIEIFRTMHTPSNAKSWRESFLSFGMLLDDRVFISGDTMFDRDLIDEYSSRSEVMFHDVQFFQGGVHAYLGELKTLPGDIKSKMYLMHYSDDWGAQKIADFAGWVLQGKKYVF